MLRVTWRASTKPCSLGTHRLHRNQLPLDSRPRKKTEAPYLASFARNMGLSFWSPRQPNFFSVGGPENQAPSQAAFCLRPSIMPCKCAAARSISRCLYFQLCGPSPSPARSQPHRICPLRPGNRRRHSGTVAEGATGGCGLACTDVRSWPLGA